jgi:membrane fusion protein (multidrug efflux system)
MNIKRWTVSLFGLAIIISTLGFIKFNQIQAAIAFGESFPEPSAAVKSSYVEQFIYSETSNVIGQLQAKKAIDIRNEYAGLITKVNIKPGDFVKKGQILFEQDVRIERANLQAEEAKLTLAESTYARLAALLKQKRTSPDKVEQARANVLIAQAQIANIKAVIDKKVIKAPFSGLLGLTHYYEGQFLNANTQLTSLIAQDDTIWVNFKLPQTLPQLTIGDMVSVNLISTDTQSSNSLKARVIAKDTAVDVSARQLAYRAELVNSQFELHHNQIVSVIVSAPSKPMLAVPTNAITRNQLGAFVYKLSQDDKKNWRAQSVQVELGDRQGDMQLIKQGLKGDEFIATEGAFKLKDQLLVYTQLPDSNTREGE